MDLLATTWFSPMFDPRSSWFGLSADVVILGLAALPVLVGFLWIRHNSSPDELTRGEARWRYRDRESLASRIGIVPGTSMADRTGGWWATRIEFAVALGALAFVIGVLLLSAGEGAWHHDVRHLAPAVAGLVGIGIGLVAMVRIYRAGVTGDSRSTWRSGSRG